MEIRDGEDNGTVLGLIQAARIAVDYRQAVRDDPTLAGGWLRKAEQWSERVNALADKIVAEGIAVPESRTR